MQGGSGSARTSSRNASVPGTPSRIAAAHARSYIKARADGGTHDVLNLACLCEAHHLAVHEGTITIRVVGDELLIERTGSNAFALAERAVQASQALKSLGWKPNKVRAAIERTKAHVGNANLSLDQWVRIALRYVDEESRR